MKKALASILVLLMSVSCLTCMAAETSEQEFDPKTKAALIEAEQYAYLDIDSASPELKEKILDARDAIIFSKNWVADGYEAFVTNENDEVVEILPEFSTVFPGWDLPKDDVASTETDSTFPEQMNPPAIVNPLSYSASTWIRLGSKEYYLPAASNTKDSPPFTSFTVDPYDMGTSIRSYATRLTSSKTYNIGYKNATTGTSLAYRNHLTLSEKFQINNVQNIKLAIRASTYSTPGYATMVVDGANRYTIAK